MSRKHFKAIAEALCNISDDAQRAYAARLMAGVCRQFNSNFDTERFYRACNVETR